MRPQVGASFRSLEGTRPGNEGNVHSCCQPAAPPLFENPASRTYILVLFVMVSATCVIGSISTLLDPLRLRADSEPSLHDAKGVSLAVDI
ncbi:hypothetical protein PYCCODRAFT_623948 [Trametes coccinea BRFM310]|uniref:Uncharacterized protein n=1 Tax=Trametes coccinea (strain BRFM310) TaxID=1353009 RepID=A0A1Y2J414_TRAC3|nr:hypothetical protein PYCCODRAFT_623948 [Trametes coccinea BRFM310]